MRWIECVCFSFNYDIFENCKHVQPSPNEAKNGVLFDILHNNDN